MCRAAVIVALVLFTSSCTSRAPARSAPGAGAVAPGVAAPFPEHYAASLAALGWPGAQRAFQVGSGSVVSSGEAAIAWTLASPRGPVTTSPVAFERDGVPIAHWTMSDGEQLARFEAAAIPLAALGDSSLLLAVRVTLEWAGADSGTVSLEARIAAEPAGPHALPPDAPDVASYDDAWDGTLALRNGRVVAGLDAAAAREALAPDQAHPAHTDGPGPGALRVLCEARLAAHEQKSFDFWMPLYPLERGLAARIARDADPERAAAIARSSWRERLGHAAVFDSPDSTLAAAWRAALVTLLQCQQKAYGRWIPIGNPFQYRDTWLRDGARVAAALATAGVTDVALDDLRSLARYQLPDGGFLSQHGQLDGTGELLWGFDRVTAVAGRDAAAEFVTPARRGLHWIASQREASAELKLPWAGLLPVADPHDNELTRGVLVGDDAWSIAGCRAVEALARRAGNDSLARAAATQLADYRATFARALARVRRADLPPTYDGEGRDWGNASAGYPTFAVAVDDPRLAALAKRMRARGGTTGLVSAGPPDSLHSYLGADLAHSDLLAGRPDEARAWLRGILAHSSSTLGQAEAFHRNGGFGTNLPPHATAAAVLVDLMRDLVVYDGRDTLDLALGMSLEDWRGTRLTGAPTRFGRADVAFAREGDLLVARVSPLGAPLRVRVPDGTRAVGARSAGARVVDGRWVLAPVGATEIRIAIAEER